MSVNAAQGLDYHLNLGAQLAPLRERGVLIVASGNVVHNLSSIDPSQPEGGFDWAHRFDADAGERLLTDPTEIGTLDAHPDWDKAAPTPDHFLPLAYLAGLAAADRDAGRADPRLLVDGCVAGSLSMSAYSLGLPA